MKLAICILFLCTLFTGVLGKTRYLGDYATITIPEEWDVIPSSWIEKAAADAKLNNSSPPDGGFYLLEHSEYPFTYPYIAYLFEPVENLYNGMNIQEALRLIASGISSVDIEPGDVKEYSLRDLGNMDFESEVLETNTPYIDIDNELVVVNYDFDLMGEKARMLWITKPFKGGALYLYFYSSVNELVKYQPEFLSMISSISVKEGFEFTGDEEKSDSTDWGYLLALALLGGLIAWYKFNKRKTKKLNIR